MSSGRSDVAVCGAGPAGLTLAVLLAERGVDVTLHDGQVGRPWTATYGLWGSELERLQLPVVASWPSVLVNTRTTRTVAQPYAVLDTARWQADLRARAAGLVRIVPEHVTSPPDARVVVDCTGHRPALVHAPQRATAWQTAYGVRARFDEPPAEGPTFMDWRGSQGSFLYALPYPDGTWLVEETSLAARPAVSLAVLRARLEQRLGPHRAVEVEKVVFPMTATPPRRQAVLAFGAAAGMVNPASGFHLGWALQKAPGLAGVLAAGGSAQDGWDLLWPNTERRRHRMLMLGLETLLPWDGDALNAFFEAFFSLDVRQSARLLTRDGSPLAVMAATWRHADTPTRVKLLAGVRRLPSV